MHGETYGGTLRALKGSLVETICENMIRQAWQDLSGNLGRLSIDRRRYYFTDAQGNKYGLSQDKQVYIDGQFRISIECKAYSELAMYKRIIVDSYILQSKFPDLKFCLFQLESMLGGGYSKNAAHLEGSPGVHVVNSFFPSVELEIITLLDGERDINKPIHNKQFYKAMKAERVEFALNYFESVLSQYI